MPIIGNPISKNAINIKESTDLNIAEAITTVKEKYGQIASFIHLHPLLQFKKGNFTQHFKIEKEILKTVFFIAKHLHYDLTEFGKKQRSSFLTVSRMDGALGQGKRNDTSVIGGGLTGLVKCLNLEWQPVFCRAVDFAPDLSNETIAKNVVEEMLDANVKIVEVAVNKNGRSTTFAKQVEVKENSEIKTAVNQQSVFLVSGGAKGVTAKCVIDMAKAFQCKFILLGRSNLDFEIPSYALKESNEAVLKGLIMADLKKTETKPSIAKLKSTYNSIVSKKEILETLEKIENTGAQAIYIKGDVTNLKSFKLELVKAEKHLGKITGLVHGAGMLADKLIKDKSETDFENVLGVKIDGLLSLLKAVNINKLQHLYLFSSVAGFYGNVGQTDYAIANEILSKTAHLFKTNHPDTHVCAINWGAWDSGMVKGALKKQLEAAGVSLVNSKGGAALMVNEFNINYFEQAQIIIGSTLPTAQSYIGDLKSYEILRTLKLEDNEFLKHHVIQGKPVLPLVNAISWLAQSCENLYPDFKVFEVENPTLFKGIVFDENVKEQYVLKIKEVEKSSEKIAMEAMVHSEGKKLPLYHYKAKITLAKPKAIKQLPLLNLNINGNYKPTQGSNLYENGVLFHGKYFRGIEQVVKASETEMILTCKIPNISWVHQGQFAVDRVNAYILDVSYQSLVVWVNMFKNGAKGLPLSTAKTTVFLDTPFDKLFYVYLKLIETNATKAVANINILDEDGLVYVRSEKCALTYSQQLTW